MVLPDGATLCERAAAVPTQAEERSATSRDADGNRDPDFQVRPPTPPLSVFIPRPHPHHQRPHPNTQTHTRTHTRTHARTSASTHKSPCPSLSRPPGLRTHAWEVITVFARICARMRAGGYKPSATAWAQEMVAPCGRAHTELTLVLRKEQRLPRDQLCSLLVLWLVCALCRIGFEPMGYPEYHRGLMTQLCSLLVLSLCDACSVVATSILTGCNVSVWHVRVACRVRVVWCPLFLRAVCAFALVPAAF